MAMLVQVCISVNYDKLLNNLSPRKKKSKSWLESKSYILQETDEQLFVEKFRNDEISSMTTGQEYTESFQKKASKGECKRNIFVEVNLTKQEV